MRRQDGYNKIPFKKSYGVACCRYNCHTKRVEVLMIHKRTTFSFVEFALGKYKRGDDNHILYLLNRMSSEEKLDIWSLDFGKIWYRIWLIDPESIYTAESLKLSRERQEKYVHCKHYFESNFIKDKGIKIRNLLSKSNTTETLWELPKGRLSFPQEKTLNCAIREFEEETGISSLEYELLDKEPYTCSIQNGKIRYVNYYFIALLNSNSKYHNPYSLKLDYNNPQQITEVIGMQWMDLDKIRVIDTTNRFYPLLKTMFRVLRKKHKLKIMIDQKII
jgi:8-oxo-dGTP pyrophosphatase MutT (NUDIX family)